MKVVVNKQNYFKKLALRVYVFKFNLLTEMKTYQKNGLPAFSPNGSAKDSMSPTMADSKSSINLCQSFEEAHKYR